MRCEAGVITVSDLQCYTPCANPLPPEPGKCCRTCPGNEAIQLTLLRNCSLMNGLVLDEFEGRKQILRQQNNRENNNKKYIYLNLMPVSYLIKLVRNWLRFFQRSRDFFNLFLWHITFFVYNNYNELDEVLSGIFLNNPLKKI